MSPRSRGARGRVVRALALATPVGLTGLGVNRVLLSYLVHRPVLGLSFHQNVRTLIEDMGPSNRGLFGQQYRRVLAQATR